MGRAARLLLSLALCGIAVGCSRSTKVVAPEVRRGSLFVRVLDPSNQVVAGAVVVLRPSGLADTTDALGTALLEGLATGDYTVLTSKQPIGSGKSVVTVKASEVSRVDLTLVPGVFFEPSVSILAPWSNAEYSYVDTARFVASVVDLEDASPTLDLAWRSDVDGPLPSPPAGNDGVARLTTDALSLGAHWISLRATDSEARTGVDSVRIVVRSFDPIVYISAPGSGTGFAPGEPITITALVQDRETPVEDLIVQWSSNLDGALSGGQPDATGAASITTAALSPGEHWIRAIVTDSDSHAKRDSVRIRNVLPGPISLAQPTVAASRVSLDWTTALAGGFARYEVYRSATPGITRSGTPIRSFMSLSDTAWVDSLPPLAAQVYYRVFVVNSFGYDRGSEERAVSAPGGLILSQVQVDDAVLHPTQPWVYLNERSTGKISVVDYRAMAVIRTATLGGPSGFIDLVDNGSGLELYVPRSDGWVQVRNANDLSLITSINTGLSNACAVGDGRGNVFVSMSPSPWWERPLRSYRRSDGSYVDGNGDFEYCRLRLVPGGQELIEITMSVSPIDMDWYALASDGHIVRHKDDLQHGGTPLDPYLYRMSPSQRYLVTSSSGALYRADSTMTYLGQLPRGSLTFGDFAFAEDGSRIYAGCSNEKLVNIYDYPSLGAAGYLQTRGYPQFLWKVGGELLSLSRTSLNQYYYGPFDLGIEVLAIPSAAHGVYPRANARRAPGPTRAEARQLRPASAER